MHPPAVPLYRRLMDFLLAEIAAGRLGPGACIPSERELSQRFDMSRMTVRHAINELVNDGVLYRYQGRGTFVSRPRIRQRLQGLSSFTQDMLSRGMEPGARVLAVEVIPAPYRVREVLGLDEGAEVVRVERLRLADGEPMALERSHLPYPRFARLTEEDLADRSLYQVLERSFGVTFGRALQSIAPAQAGAHLAEALQVKEGSLLLLLERITFSQQEQPIEFVSSYYRADRYRFEVELAGR